MEKTKKLLKNLAIFIILIGITFYVILKEQNIMDIYNVFSMAKLKYVIIAIICMCLYLILEGVNLGRTLKALKEKTSFLKNTKYSLIGFFFSSITPAASGGQPMQIYYMHKDNISIANSTLALLINLCSMQIVTLSFAFISLFVNLKNIEPGLIVLFIIGVSLNSTALVLLLIGIFSKRLSKGLINFCVKVLKFFKVKNIEAKQERIEKELTQYQGSATYFKSHRPLMLKVLITTIIQFIIYYSIPYWVYCSFGFSEYNIFKIITLQSVLYATVSGIPSPGAVGVTEGGFLSVFKAVFPSTMISGAMLLNRGISFYVFVLLSGIFVTFISIKTKKIEHDNIKELDDEKSTSE